MLHLLNGDATASVFPPSLPGERAVWRDILVEGPPVDDGAARARWLAPRLGIAVEDYERTWRDGQALLARAAACDEIVLWFEQDLFCAVNLWFVLSRLPPAAVVSLVFPPLDDAFAGLGTLSPDDFAPLFADRRRLDPAGRADAVALWSAYADSDPTGLTRLDPRLPFGREAALLHLLEHVEPLQHPVGFRNQRFADVEARKLLAFEQTDLDAALREQCGGRGTGGTSADDDDVVLRCDHESGSWKLEVDNGQLSWRLSVPVSVENPVPSVLVAARATCT